METKCLVCQKIIKSSPYLLRIGRTKYCSKKCYGISKKGKSTWIKGKHLSYKTKRKLSLAVKRAWRNGSYTEDSRYKMGTYMRGRKRTKKIRAKISQAVLGVNNSQWKGNKVGYGALHRWVRRHLPKKKFCQNCKIEAPYDLANISQLYKRDLSDWEWLCRRCHMIKDKRLVILHKNNCKKQLATKEAVKL